MAVFFRGLRVYSTALARSLLVAYYYVPRRIRIIVCTVFRHPEDINWQIGRKQEDTNKKARPTSGSSTVSKRCCCCESKPRRPPVVAVSKRCCAVNGNRYTTFKKSVCPSVLCPILPQLKKKKAKEGLDIKTSCNSYLEKTHQERQSPRA